VHEAVKPFDWTYTTDYAGTLASPVDGHVRDAASCRWRRWSVALSAARSRSLHSRWHRAQDKPEPTDLAINYEVLKRPDPILFYDELILFEDELADNGAAQLTCRIVRRCIGRDATR